jgi:hypothetical protein
MALIQRRKVAACIEIMLAGQLPKHIDLTSRRGVEGRVAVTEVDGGVPHLKARKEHVSRALHPVTIAVTKNFRRIDVVRGIT